MGWWSETVMGGDTPLDYECDIFHIAGVDFDKYFDDEYKEGEIRQLLLDNLEEIVTRVRDGYIGSQVLGVEVMRFGLPADHPRVQEALQEARSGAECDEWAFSDKTRKQYMDAFIKQINEYDGTPTEISSEGLLEVIAEHLEAGGKGLVNKDGP